MSVEATVNISPLTLQKNLLAHYIYLLSNILRNSCLLFYHGYVKVNMHTYSWQFTCSWANSVYFACSILDFFFIVTSPLSWNICFKNFWLWRSHLKRWLSRSSIFKLVVEVFHGGRDRWQSNTIFWSIFSSAFFKFI